MKWVAFDNRARLIPDEILSRIIDQAVRGKMTQAASKLLLIPDKRKGRPDISGLREMGRVRKRDCMTVGQFARRVGKRPSKTQKPRKVGL